MRNGRNTKKKTTNIHNLSLSPKQQAQQTRTQTSPE
jgi:hypothetical protein